MVFLPETKGRRFESIETLFLKKDKYVPVQLTEEQEKVLMS